MAQLSGGTFKMGERGDLVSVRPFSLDVTEVTADAYAACVRTGRCSADHPGEWTPEGTNFAVDGRCNYGVAGKGNHPMNCVDWNQATAFCRWAGKRLPTEAEWEWAARGQNRGTTYPWGNDEPASQACWDRAGTCPVGSYPEGDAPGGIHDLAGNVWEWTASNYGAGAFSSMRVLRGGGCLGDATSLRASYRFGDTPLPRVYYLGFRCARTP
jgi:formylglycine-generating enzyme required for sulfatase activity